MSADHPYIDPGDGRTECYLCGKFIHEVTHSCKGVPVTPQAEARVRALIDAVRADERRRCVEAWRDEGRDVMFNRAGDDLTPWERVEKWLSGLGGEEVEGR